MICKNVSCWRRFANVQTTLTAVHTSMYRLFNGRVRSQSHSIAWANCRCRRAASHRHHMRWTAIRAANNSALFPLTTGPYYRPIYDWFRHRRPEYLKRWPRESWAALLLTTCVSLLTGDDCVFVLCGFSQQRLLERQLSEMTELALALAEEVKSLRTYTALLRSRLNWSAVDEKNRRSEMNQRVISTFTYSIYIIQLVQSWM
jgi:hypothetical protein